MYFILCKNPSDVCWQLYSQESRPREQALAVIPGLKRNGYEVKLLEEDNSDYVAEAEEVLWQLKTRDEIYRIKQIISKV